MTGLQKLDQQLSELMRIREYLSVRKHWLQGHAANNKGSYCLVGAVGFLVEDHLVRSAMFMQFEGVAFDLGYRPGPPYGLSPVAVFNDERTTTHADAIAFVDIAIERRIKEIA